MLDRCTAPRRVVQVLQAAKQASDVERDTRRKHGKPDRTPQQQFEAEHRPPDHWLFRLDGSWSSFCVGDPPAVNTAGAEDPRDSRTAV